jgi:hypothetical protein
MSLNFCLYVLLYSSNLAVVANDRRWQHPIPFHICRIWYCSVTLGKQKNPILSPIISTDLSYLYQNYCSKAKQKNQCIRGKTGAENIVKEIKQYQEKWLQHIQGMDTNRTPKQALQYKPKGRRHIGRPRKRWRSKFHFEDTRNRNQT